MFTGIIKHIGTCVISGSKLLIYYFDEDIAEDLKIGDSVAINGVCLTVININNSDKILEFFVMLETLNKTFFGEIENDKMIFANIERSIKNNDEIGGHIIQGHIHDVGSIISIENNSDKSIDIWILCNKYENIKYKDSIAVNGVSLTIAQVNNDKFRISLIPHTQTHTTLEKVKPGDSVNIEYNISNVHQVINDEYFMDLAIKEANKGRLTAPPNPWVGAIIVYNHEIIGRGYHVKAGTPHAEFNAINHAIKNGYVDKLNQSILYITLEPCHHFHGKRTPACDTLIINYKFKKIIIGMLDPDPNVSGMGVDTIRNNNIEVVVGLLENKIRKSLRSYIHHRQTKTPYVIIKTALSMDGYPCLQNNDSKWITGNESRQHAHKIRSKSQAIIIGNGTVLNDNPTLNVRLDNLPDQYCQPLRVVIDRFGKIISGNILNQNISKTLIITSDQIDNNTLDIWKRNKVEYIVLPFKNGKLILNELLILLGQKGILQCLIEGGPFLHDCFYSDNLYQELHIYYGNIIIGSNGKNWSNQSNFTLANILKHNLVSTKKLNNDVFTKYNNNKQINQDNINDTSIQSVIFDLKNGNPIILMDDENRENEGDLVIGAQFMTPEICTFFITNTTGMICVPMEERKAKILNLPKMLKVNEDPNCTSFTVSCDHLKAGTGVSAHGRTITINALANDSKNAQDFTRPGHIFPLISSKGGIYERQGHTEGSIELCKLAGIKPVSAIAELMNKNGTMMNYQDCCKFAKDNNLNIITMKELINYVKLNKSTRIISSCELELKNYGSWELICYHSGDIHQPHKVLVKGNIYDNTSPITVRVHSECFTGDVLGSLLCDCGDQLELSLKKINNDNRGIIIFPANHEGRGIGLHNKVLAYRKMKNSQNKINTYDANKLLGLPEDARNYDCVVDILNDLNIDKINLLTANINKIKILENKINKIIPLTCEPSEFNSHYLQIKHERNDLTKLQIKNDLTLLHSKIDYVNNAFNIDINKSTNIKIGLIYTIWNGDIINDFVSQIEYELHNLGINNIKNIKKWIVPGSFEIPYLIKKLIKQEDIDIIICVGAIIKGDTAHFEYISSSVINALMNIQVDMEFPIINGILNCYNKDQAVERFKPENGLAKSLALSTLHTVNNCK